MITLIENYEIHGSKYDYSLVINTGKVDKNGNTVYKIEGYYSSVQSCIKACYKKLCLKTVAEEKLTLTQALERFDAIQKRLEDIIPNSFG